MIKSIKYNRVDKKVDKLNEIVILQGLVVSLFPQMDWELEEAINHISNKGWSLRDRS